MSIVAVFTTICDGCDVTVVAAKTLTAESARHGLGWYTGWPNGWSQWAQEPDPADPEVERGPLFFHDEACLKAWLIRNGKAHLAAEMDNWEAIA